MGNLGEMVVAITGEMTGFNNAIDAAERRFDDAMKTFTRIGKNLTTFVTLPILAIGAAAVKSSADMEMLQASFTTMLGDASKAKKFLEEIKKMAAATPFDTTQLATAAKTLKQFGVETANIIPTLKQIGDISGGSADKMASLSLAFGQMSSAGRLMGQDLLQMINAGFNPLNEIAKRTGESMAELKDRMSKGGITAREVARAFEDVTSAGGMFFGGMERGSQTLTGLTSTLRDDVMEMARSFGDMLLPKIKDFVKYLSEWAKKLQAMSPDQKEMVLKIAILAASIGPLILGISGAAKMITTLSTAIKFLNASALSGPLGLIALLAASIIALVTFAQNAKKAQDRLKDLYENPQNYGTEELDKQLVGMNKTLAQINKERSEQEASMRRQGATQKEINSSLEATFGAEERMVTVNRNRVQVEVDKRHAIEAQQRAQEARDAAELEAIKKSLDMELSANQEEMTDAERTAWYKENIEMEWIARINQFKQDAHDKEMERREKEKKATEKRIEEEKKKLEELKAAYSSLYSFIGTSVSDLGTILNDVSTNRINALDQELSDAKELYGEDSEEYKKLLKKKYDLELAQFKTNQAFSIATTIIQTAEAAMKIYSSLAALGPIVAGIGAGMAVALGAGKVAAIAGQVPPAAPFADGGIAMAKPGGLSAIVAEAGENEAIMSLSKFEQYLDKAYGGNSEDNMIHLVVQMDSRPFLDTIFSATKNKTVLISAKAVV